MYSKLKKEMNAYYRKMDMKEFLQFGDEQTTSNFRQKFYRIFDEMDNFLKENPQTPTVLLKSKTHTLMAKYCEPVIFMGNPFFFELGYNQSKSWGLRDSTPASWLKRRKQKEISAKHPLCSWLTRSFWPTFDGLTNNLCSIFDSFDIDHNTLGYSKLFAVGVKGLISQAKEQMLSFNEGTEEHAFCQAVIESSNALIEIAHKFAYKAQMLLADCKDEKSCKYLNMIAQTALKIPENPPETFYEGLAMLLFTREAIANMENIGISQLGHVDRLLGPLYEQDLVKGRITEQEANELVAIWMMYTDIKFDLENNQWPETSTCIQLGGCDEFGKTVFNDVTKIFIKQHHLNKLVNPKLNCRYFDKSPDEYLKLMGRAILDGHNTFALINDDVIIEGLTKSGVELQDARLYVNGGCQETMIEGFGHTEGAAIYISMLRFLDLFLRSDKNAEIVTALETEDATTYEDFYEKFLTEFNRFFSLITDQRNYRQHFYKETLKSPLFSATQKGCIENGKDYVLGGAKYNFSTVAIVGFANVVDSLYSIKKLVYDEKRVTLKEFISILEANWEGHQEFRREVIALHKYGHNQKDVDELANKFITDLSTLIKSKKNERGGNYLPSTFVYKYNRTFARLLRATPDGRKDFEYMAAGCSPSLLQPIKDILSPIKTINNVDFSACGGGISVLDMMLPVSANFDENVFANLMIACNKSKCVTLQPNVVSVKDLLDAQKNPDKHKNLIVRICGLSAFFVALTPEVQDEIINRNFYNY